MSVRLIDPRRVTLHQLRRAVRGEDEALPRGAAMSLLQASAFPQRHRDYELVLRNPAEPSTLRALAAQHLGRVGTTAARAVLMEHGGVEPELVRLAVVKALGRTGGAEALDVVRRAGTGGSHRLAAEARFAETLIAHRLGLPGPDDPLPEPREMLTLPASFVLTGSARPALASTVTRCLAALAEDPYGIVYAEDAAVQLSFGDEDWMVLLNRDFTGADSGELLYRRPALLGVVAERDAVDDSYWVALLLLATPEEGGVRLHLHRTDGDLIYLGRLEGEAFTIRTVDRPDALPLELRGRLGEGREGSRLVIEAAHTAMMTAPKQRPRPLARSDPGRASAVARQT